MALLVRIILIFLFSNIPVLKGPEKKFVIFDCVWFEGVDDEVDLALLSAAYAASLFTDLGPSQSWS